MVFLFVVACGSRQSSVKVGLGIPESPWPVKVVKKLESLPNRMIHGDEVIAEYQEIRFHSKSLIDDSKPLRHGLSQYEARSSKEPLSHAQKLDHFLFEREIFDEVMSVIFKRIIRKKGLVFKKGESLTQLLSRSDLRGYVKIYFKPPEFQLTEAGEWPIVFGDEEARETFDFFGNFNCPDCVKTLNSLVERMGKENTFNIRFRFSAVPGSPKQKELVETALCIKEQGLQKFYNFYYNIADRTKAIGEYEILGLVRSLGVNVDQMNQCRFGGALNVVSQYHFDYSRLLRISKLPTVVLRGHRLEGPTSLKFVARFLARPTDPSIVERAKRWMKSHF